MTGSSRQRILDITAELFDRYGYHGTSIQKISSGAGLGRGALYHHIGSKEELLYEISISLLHSITDAAREVVESDVSPDEKLRRLSKQIVAHPAIKKNAWSAALRDAHVLTDEHREEVLAARREYEQQWAAVFAEGAAAELWRPISAVELRGILGMFNSTARWVQTDGEMTTDEIAQAYLGLLLDGLRNPEADQ